MQGALWQVRLSFCPSQLV